MTTNHAPANEAAPDPTADWPVPYSLTPVAETLLDAEASWAECGVPEAGS
jgi:hypothetical protein